MDWRRNLEPNLAPGESYDERTILVPLTMSVRIKAYHKPSGSPPWTICAGPGRMPPPDAGPPSEPSADFQSGVDALVCRAVKAMNAGLRDTAFRIVAPDEDAS